MASGNPLRQYDPLIDKDFTQTRGAAGGPSSSFTSLVTKLAARRDTKNAAGLAAYAGKMKAKRQGGGK